MYGRHKKATAEVNMYVQWHVLLVYSYFKKGCYNQSILEPKGTVGIVIMSDNTPAKFATYGRGIMMNLHSIYYAKSMLEVLNYLRNLNPTVPFGSSIDYWLWQQFLK